MEFFTMPIIKSAKKKMRKDKLRTERNEAKRITMKGLIKNARRNTTVETLKAVFSSLDKAAKTKLIHPNKAARLKSRLSKGNSSTGISAKTAKKKVIKKTSAKKK
jgi:small subunit ribosomal protein S20